MSYQISIPLSILALLMSAVALYFTFKKDAHRLNLKTEYLDKFKGTLLHVNNDSSFEVKISAIGAINSEGKIIWLTSNNIADYHTSKFLHYPFSLGMRSTPIIEVNLIRQNIGRYSGYCCKLVCGRTFVVMGEHSTKVKLRFIIESYRSRLQLGEVSLFSNKLHIKP